MKRDKKSHDLFAETSKDIAKTFQKAFNRGFWTGMFIGLLINGCVFAALMFYK